MSGVIKLAIGIVIAYGIVAWTLGNPNSATSFVDKVETAYEYSAQFVSEHLFDNKEER
jgi:hypothetical protein